MGKNPRYSQEFKESAVKLVTDIGYSYAEAASHLGCSSWSIRQWEKQICGEAGAPDEIADSGQDIRKLREENAKLRMENEILKKAAAYFAKESL